MKELISYSDKENINKPYLIFYTYDGIILSKKIEDYLNKFECQEKNINFYVCKNIDICVNMGYTKLPLVEMVTNDKIRINDELSNITEQDLEKWINENIGE